MSRIDLNIVDRGIQGSNWIAEDTGLTPEHLDAVLEQKTDNSGALNSLPTPFARFFVAKEAFRRAMEEHISSKKEAGFAYRQMVSDILDVYELLFNLKYHVNNSWKSGEKVELREWNAAENLVYLKAKMPVLYNSINEYYSTDIREEKLYFLVYTEDGHDKLLACTSPLTGFVTPPDMDKSLKKQDASIYTVFAGQQYDNLHIRRKSGGEYFREIKMFEDRDKDFKNYMYRLFGSDDIDPRFKTIKEYIRSFKNDDEIRNDFKQNLVGIKTDQNDDLIVNGLVIKSSDEIDIDSYFNPTLIKVPYRIDRERFASIEYQNDIKERDYDYLMPFKPEIVNLFDGKDIDADLHINRNSVTVELRYNGETYKKEYAEEQLKPGMGRIVDMQKALISFDLGLFPNILSHKDEENNYFKLLVIGADESPDAPNFNIDQIFISFFKKSANGLAQIHEREAHEADFGVLPAVVRSRQKSEEMEGGTKFYEIYNTSFDLIEVDVLGDRGILMPQWEHSEATNTTFKYAIDLGTSNTFISRCLEGGNNKPELFSMLRPMVSYMHETPEDMQISLARRIEGSIFEKAQKRIKTEFLPAFIDGKDYKFPIRTALCGILSQRDLPRLFDNHNIAFFYEKLMADDDQNVKTDIKWQNNGEYIRLFIQELLLIIKCDILQRNGDLDRTSIVWFRPLSFTGTIRSAYKKAWEEETARILRIQPSQIDCYSESEAPYYYFKKMDYIKDSEAVSVIDIGGGSTDFVYFKDNKPVMANSVHFGCDVLWGNGFVEFVNEKQNGIYKRYADSLRFRRDDLEELNTCFKNVDDNSTKDIINFWLGNSDFCDIKQHLSEDFKPVFVYHFTSIMFYMASMFKDHNCPAPKTIVFSGNGSKYIDGFICSEREVLKKIIDKVFTSVFGGEHNVILKLPVERKEATCYGGLYRSSDAESVPEKVYQGDMSASYEKVGDMTKNFGTLKKSLMDKYAQFNTLYKEVLDLLKKERILDSTADTTSYVRCANEDMGVPLATYYKSQVEQKFSEEVELFDSVFFLPIIDRVFQMTKI